MTSSAGTDTPPPGVSPAATDIWKTTYDKQNGETDARIAAAIDGPHGHVAGEFHHGRFQLVAIGCDMGVPGTVLTLTGIWGHRVMEFPVEVFNWKVLASPAAGTCVVDVLKAANLEAFNTGTYASVCDAGKLTLTAARQASGAALGVWPITSWLPGEVLVWQLVSVSGSVEVLTAQLGVRRV